MIYSRRRVLRLGGMLAGISAAGLPLLPARAVPAEAGEQPRRIALLNLHTDERLDIEYFRDGAYLHTALGAIATLLRDHRSGEQHAMDPGLMDYLVDVAKRVGVPPEFSVISGYRSPLTNAQLRRHSSEVSQHSLHMQGRAIDVRMAQVDCATLASQAQDLARGGVGYYRASNFVHMDTGPYRTWRG